MWKIARTLSKREKKVYARFPKEKKKFKKVLAFVRNLFNNLWCLKQIFSRMREIMSMYFLDFLVSKSANNSHKDDIKMFRFCRSIFCKSIVKLNSHNIRNLKMLATRRVRPFYLFQRLYDFNNCKRWGVSESPKCVVGNAFHLLLERTFFRRWYIYQCRAFTIVAAGDLGQGKNPKLQVS